jgi:2-oxoisovalerate ferredoxin oxidoreductase beta subunit
VALSDNKNIMKARRAVRKALELQKAGAGFTFVEILSPCPTIWGKGPIEARKWVGEKMIPNFPLEVFRDRKVEITETNAPPHKTVQELVEGERQAAKEAMVHGKHHRFGHMGIKIAGFGGQGVLLLGQFEAGCADRDQRNLTTEIRVAGRCGRNDYLWAREVARGCVHSECAGGVHPGVGNRR